MESREFSTYLTFSEEDEKWQLVCVDAGYAVVPPLSPYPPTAGEHPADYRTVATGRTVREYQLVYITRGRGTLRVSPGNDPVAVNEGDVITVLPGLTHSYRPDPETGWTERWVGFKGPWADALRKQGLLSAERPLFSPGLESGILEPFEELFWLVREQRPYYQARSSALVIRLLAETMALSRHSREFDDTVHLVDKAKYVMAERVHENLRVEDLGEELGVGHVRFYETFKAYTGMTPYQYFIQLKLNRAKELLSGRACSVKETAYRLGFDDPYYFSRLFKKKTGIAPSEWM